MMISGKGGHFCYYDGKKYNLQLTKSVPLVLNDFDILFNEFTEGAIALPMGQI